MLSLDSKDEVVKAQGGDAVLNSITALPDQIKQSFTESRQIAFPQAYKNVDCVVVCGMGGSRFPALIIQHLFKTRLKVPYIINDDYILPSFVNDKTLVFLSSYSGTTEEIIACGKQAIERKAQVTGSCVGADIASLLKDNGYPAYIFDPKYNPSKQPRIGFGYAVGAQMGMLISLGLLDVEDDEVLAAIDAVPALLTSFTLGIEEKDNPAKQLAKKLVDTYPYFIVSEFLTGIGNGIQNQVNETAKAISSYRVVSELNHHLMEGLKHPVEHQKMGVFVLFYSNLYSPAIQKRFHITKDVVEQNKLRTIWHELHGKSQLEQAFELMGLGSYVSMYLSALYGEDPTAIPYVDYFKKRLKEMK